MSPARSASVPNGGGGRAAITALIVLAAAIVMLLLVRTRASVEAFDPRSSRGDGASAVVQLLRDFGATVTVSAQAPTPGAAGRERVLVISDALDAAQRADLLAFVNNGGVAVVADPASTLHAGRDLDHGAVAVDQDQLAFESAVLDAAVEANVSSGDCTIAALARLRGVMSPAGILFPADTESDFCLTDENGAAHAFVIVREYGTGRIVGFGDNRIVTNDYLRYADNSGLVTALLAPQDGAEVRIMIGAGTKPEPDDVGTGTETLVDLVRPGIWMGLSQLAIAFVVLCIARGVRPGRAVRETLPAPIAGNELVVATGNVMQRARHYARAGWLVRGEFYRELCSHYGLARNSPIDQLATVVGRQSGVDPARVRAVLERDVGSADELLALSTEIDHLRRHTLSIAEPV